MMLTFLLRVDEWTLLFDVTPFPMKFQLVIRLSVSVELDVDRVVYTSALFVRNVSTLASYPTSYAPGPSATPREPGLYQVLIVGLTSSICAVLTRSISHIVGLQLKPTGVASGE